jgi:hypothetical protein
MRPSLVEVSATELGGVGGEEGGEALPGVMYHAEVH